MSEQNLTTLHSLGLGPDLWSECVAQIRRSPENCLIRGFLLLSHSVTVFQHDVMSNIHILHLLSQQMTGRMGLGRQAVPACKTAAYELRLVCTQEAFQRISSSQILLDLLGPPSTDMRLSGTKPHCFAPTSSWMSSSPGVSVGYHTCQVLGDDSSIHRPMMTR